MTASRNTILAIGLTLVALAAGRSALGASFIAFDNSASDAGGYTAGSDAAGASGGIGRPEGFCQPDHYGAKTGDAEDNSLFGACTQYFNDCSDICAGCTWKAEASVLVMHRATPGTKTVLTDATGADLFDASRLEFPFAAGPRISLTGLDCEGWGFELNCFGIDGWSASGNVSTASLPGAEAFLTIDNSINGKNVPVTDPRFESIARLYSTEVNFRRPLFGNLAFLAGFRWLDMMDQYSTEATSAVTGNPFSETIRTHNHLFGLQIGADGTLLQQSDRWRLAAFVKGGVFLNNANQTTSFSDPADSLSYTASGSRVGGAFFGETGVVGYLQITKHLAASGGYQVMFVNGVAQPVNQLAGTDLENHAAKVDASSGLFYHGATAGLELTW